MIDFNIEKINQRVNNANLHATPVNIADDMVELLVDTGFFDEPTDDMTAEDYVSSHRVLDIYCKSGSLLYACYKRFMVALRHTIPDKDDRDYFIVRNLLYGVCPSINCINTLRDMFYNNKKYDLSHELGNFFLYDLEKEEGSDKDIVKELLKPMKFDVVVGNPPYNNDAYIDFVMLGHRLAKTYDLWITPAKFWAKSTCDKDKEFRSMVKDSGDSFVVYKNCKDIFDISEPGGIAYYLLGKDNKNSKYRIKCVHKNSVAFQSDFEAHTNLDFLPLHTLNILNKLGKSNFKDTISLKRNYFTNSDTYSGTSDSSLPIIIVQGNKIVGYTDRGDLKTLENLGMYKCIQNCICGSGSFQADDDGAFLGMPPVYVLKPNEIGKGSFHHLRFFNTASEANHFVEFMSTKLVNFAYICGLCGTTNSSEFYRYIPDQGSFDCIFEDEPSSDLYTKVGVDSDGCPMYLDASGLQISSSGEYIDADGNKHCSLYVKYKLTQQEIDVIESVIRERK